MTAETLCLACFFVFHNETKFMGNHAVLLVKTFPLAYHLLLAIRLTLTKLGRFLFSGYRQTGFWNHAGTQISTRSSKLGVNCRSLYASPDDRDA